MSALHSVSYQEDESPLTRANLPAFEDQPVDLSRIKLTGANALDVGDHVSHIDDIVKLYIEGRVVRVDHVVDGRTGRLIRVHTIQVRDAVQVGGLVDA